MTTLHRRLLPLFALSTVLLGAAGSGPGLDLAGMDTRVPPGDDFYTYANGGWLERTEIPADRSSYGVFAVLSEETDRRTAELIQSAGQNDASGKPPGPVARRVADYYAAYMDEAQIERLGIRPIERELARIAAIEDKRTLAMRLGEQLRADVDPLNLADFQTDRLFGVWVSPDFELAGRNSVYLLQGGLGLPDRDYYFATDAHGLEIQKKYRDYIEAMLTLAAVAPAETAAPRAAAIYELEKKIAATHSTRTESLDVLKANNRWLLSEFVAKAQGMPWRAFFDGARLSGQTYIRVWHPTAVSGTAALFGSESLEVWKDYFAFHVVDRAAPWLSKAFADRLFEFRGKVLTGATVQRDRWKRAVSATNAALGDSVGQLYVERYFPPEAKAAGEAMVRDILAAFDRRLAALDWMTPATREKARAKAAALRIGIGYPDTWEDESELLVKRDDALGNAQRAEKMKYEHALRKLIGPVDKDEWWMTPQTVNAVNLPLQNAMNFPAAILAPPFFDPAADVAQNYGGIGTVIGHEISHSFDDQGAQFDAEGRLLNWWTDEDRKRFEERAAHLVAQYDAYEPLPGSRVNGKLTLSENIADLAGVAAAFDAYRNATASATAAAGDAPALTQGFTNDQRFFLSFAQVWRGKYRPEALRNRLLTDGHSPGKYRVYTVRNLDSWYEAFAIPPGSALFLTPENRVRIW